MPCVRCPPWASEPEDPVAGLGDRVQHRRVRGRARVRLHVREVGAEQALGPLDREVLGDVDLLAAAVVALAGVALGVLVGQHAALGLQHRAGDEVLAGDHLQRVPLAGELAVEDGGDLRVELGERSVGELVTHGRFLREAGGGFGATLGPGGRPLVWRDSRRSPVVTHLCASRDAVEPTPAACRPCHARRRGQPVSRLARVRARSGSAAVGLLAVVGSASSSTSASPRILRRYA